MRSPLAGARAVVTGGAGFLGAHLCRALLEAGASVACVDNEVTGSKRNVTGLARHRKFSYHRADITEGLPEVGRIDLLFHLASIASPLQYAEHPIETLRSGSIGTLNMIEVARRQQARLVFSSTSEVYGDPLVSPQPESYWGNVNPVGPRAVYDESKRFAEAAIVGARAQWDVDAAIVRIFNTYGPLMALDDGRAVPAFIEQALRGEPITIFGDGSQTRSLCYVSDTVAGLIAMAQSAQPGPINLGNPQELTVLELAQRILRSTGSASPIEFGPPAPDDPRTRCPDIALAGELLGWKPAIGLDEGLARTVHWFRDVLVQPTASSKASQSARKRPSP